MQGISDYINSGIIEEYVLGLCSNEDKLEVEQLAQSHPEILSAINNFSQSIEHYTNENLIEPDPAIKPMLIATIDFLTRLEKGEQPLSVPLLTPQTTVEDFHYWLNRPDIVLPVNKPDVYAKIIGSTPEVTTAIVWLREAAPAEVHTNTYERFLVIEGSCTISIEDTLHNLVPGDFLSIPLQVSHVVTVTSTAYCKIILQRVAA
jgi:mannose-6-phosphate isomerase-like protein (cupin superfamily)